MKKADQTQANVGSIHAIQTAIYRILNMATQICVIPDLDNDMSLIRRPVII